MAVVEKEVRKMKNPKTCKLHDEKRETWKGKTAADESSDESSVTTQWWVERERSWWLELASSLKMINKVNLIKRTLWCR